MVETVITVAIEAAKCLADPISRRLRYLFCFNQFIGDVGNAKDELLPKLEEVKMRRDEATRKTEEIMPTVKNWLDDVEAILREVEKLQQDVEKLQQEAEEGGKKCYNVSLRYSLAKQMENKAKRMEELKNSSHFELFSYLIPLPAINYLPFKGFVEFNSRKSTYNSLLEAIKDDKDKMVGLYGIGGSGKTTLAKEVGRKVYELKVFEKVIMVVVSKPPNVVNIQQEIAKNIGVDLEEERQSHRAQRLRIGLKNKKILIILDDVWNTLDLQDIGIPLDDGCCILLTTRLRNVCVSMGCDSKIELPLLTKEEAWALFKMRTTIATNGSSNNFDDVGRKIVDECKGLPIAIVAVGSTLKEKNIEEWELALWELQHSRPLDVEEGLRSPYACLKLSYDNLPSPLAKSLFLLCSIFPEDHEISKEDLIRFGKGTLELDDEIADTMQNSRRRILSTINKLINSCLLMPTDRQECVKMHDMVRDVALWIAKEQRRAILVDSHVDSNALNNNKSVNDTKVISLWNLDENFKLSIQLHSPTLEILLLHPQEFIEDLGGIEALKVLALITFSFKWCDVWWRNRSQWSMPTSIVSLTNLHTLCLRGIVLGDISFLDKLKGLEILDLHGSSFNELPDGIGDMKMLKLLDVFGCIIEKSPYEVIGRCGQLQELFLGVEAYSTPQDFSISKLKRYVISDSTCNLSIYQHLLDGCVEALRALSMEGSNVSVLSSSMKDLILRADTLWLKNCTWDNKDINSKITHLVVSCCPQLITIFTPAIIPKQNDIDEVRVVNSELSYLELDNLPELEYIWKNPTQSVSLHKLEEVRLFKCSKLKTVFSYVITPSLSKLRELYIVNCSKLERLVEVEADEEATQRRDQLLFSKLNTIELRRLPKLREIFPGFEHKHMQDYPEINENDRQRAVNLDLSYLKLDNLPKLKYIWKGPIQTVSLYRLEEVRLSHCSKLRTIFTHTVIPRLPELRELHIWDCCELEGLVEGEADEEATQRRDQLLFSTLNTIGLGYLPKLREIFPGLEYKHIQDSPKKCENDGISGMVNSELFDLNLKELPKLEYIWKGPAQTVSLHRLESVSMYKCSKLRTIFTYTIFPRLPELRKLWVINCEEWEGIICEDSLKNQCANLSSSNINVCFPKLSVIGIYECSKVKWVFSSYDVACHCPSLEFLAIEDCSEVEGVVNKGSLEGEAHPHPFFPKLNELRLIGLPNMREIYPGFDFNPMQHDIQDCPNINMDW